MFSPTCEVATRSSDKDGARDPLSGTPTVGLARHARSEALLLERAQPPPGQPFLQSARLVVPPQAAGAAAIHKGTLNKVLPVFMRPPRVCWTSLYSSWTAVFFYNGV